MRLFVFCLISAISSATLAQSQYPQHYFRNPLDVPISLSANFGELRPNHWHMGLDIRTQQRENLPVHAAAEGYIAKIKIEPGGFGQAIYINHPNGYTTLYAHLNTFFPALAEWVKEQQYKQESWAVELTVPQELFPVHKGDLIAYSGNTGGSQGPHLHFEIRDTKTENCLNPLLFGMPLADAVPPSLVRLAMYDRNKSVYEQSPQLLGLKKTAGGYTLAANKTIVANSDKVSFGLQMFDRQSGSNNPNGVYAAKIYCDGTPLTSFELNDINYNVTRYVNAQMDYAYREKGGAYLQHLSKMPGDFSDVYKQLQNDGIINLADTITHQVTIEVTDPLANMSTLQFSVRRDPSFIYKEIDPVADIVLMPGQMNVMEKEDFEIVAGENAVYDMAPVQYTRTTEMPAGAVSAAHKIGAGTIPLHLPMTVRIKPVVAIAEQDKNKIVIVKDKGGRGDALPAAWQNGWLAAPFREFGTFRAFVDHAPPQINALGKGDTINLGSSKRIVFYPKDNFGIKSFRAELDGRWLRFTNDKHYAYIYNFDEKCSYGVHSLKVTVQDLVGNTTEETWWFRRSAYTAPVKKAVTHKKTVTKKKSAKKKK